MEDRHAMEDRPIRVHKLTKAEIDDLERLYRTTQEADARTRCQILVLSNWGRSVDEIARLVVWDESEVGRWISRCEREGLAALEA